MTRRRRGSSDEMRLRDCFPGAPCPLGSCLEPTLDDLDDYHRQPRLGCLRSQPSRVNVPLVGPAAMQREHVPVIGAEIEGCRPECKKRALRQPKAA